MDFKFISGKHCEIYLIVKTKHFLIEIIVKKKLRSGLNNYINSISKTKTLMFSYNKFNFYCLKT